MQRALFLAAVSAPFLALALPMGNSQSSASLALVSPMGAAPAIGALAPAAGFAKGKTVAISTEDGLDLAATFYAPRKDQAPAVLLIHDAGADRQQFNSIADRLQKRGFGVMSLDLRGHGESKSDKLDWSKMSEEERPAAWQRSPRDVDAAAHWLLSQKSILPTNLSLVGLGAGCALAARHAEADENVISLMLLNPKAKDFGFDVESTLINVEGLPTCVIGKRGEESEAVVESIHQAVRPWIKWEPVSVKSGEIWEDRKTASKIADWMGDVAMPKKSKKGKG